MGFQLKLFEWGKSVGIAGNALSHTASILFQMKKKTTDLNFYVLCIKFSFPFIKVH